MSIVESLKRLLDPAAARQEEAERKADRERPIREDTGPDRWFECRVCHHVGPEPTFCPTCLAGTMRPTRARPAEAEVVEGEDSEEAGAGVGDGNGNGNGNDVGVAGGGDGVAAVPFDGTLDLHTFAPREVKELLPEYLLGCQERGQLQVRVVHGKGTGALRRTVHALLRRDPRVESFRSASEDAGGWGATLVTLRPRDPATE